MHFQYRGLFTKILVLVLSQPLSGCFVYQTPVKEVAAKVELLEDKYDEVVPRKTNRKEVIDILGKPVISSRHLKFDIFNRTARQYEIPFATIIPFSITWDTINVYTLITYDVNDIVDGISYSQYRSGFRSSVSEQCRIDTNRFSFIIKSHHNDRVILYYPPSITKYIGNISSSNSCTIVTISEDTCSDTLSIDGNKEFLWPNNSIFISKLIKGEHDIEFSGSILNGSESIYFECKNGDIIYFTTKCINIKYINKLFKRSSAEFIIKIHDSIPEEYTNYPVLIWRDGNWLIDNY